MKERRTNFFMVDNRIFEYDLKPRDIAVYCFLCRRLNRENNVAFPSRKDIAKGCGIKKEETVDKALKVLTDILPHTAMSLFFLFSRRSRLGQA